MPVQPHRLLLAVVACSTLAGASAARAQDLEQSLRTLVEVEARTRTLVQTPLRTSPLHSATYVEERLADAEMFFRLQDYVSASVILTDIVEHYPQHRALPDAVFLLAESLFKAGDFLGARNHYRLVIQRADQSTYQSFVEPALGRLIEIAIHIDDFTGVDEYFTRLSQLPPSAIGAGTQYFRAKYLYSLALRPAEDMDLNVDRNKVQMAQLEQARQVFSLVGATSTYYPQARYFIGVIDVLRGQYGSAVNVFRGIAEGVAGNDEHRRVGDLARLAMGRVHYEFGHVNHAIAAYQAVTRSSPVFDTALYELAWVYIRQGDGARAERALEMLSVAVPNSPYVPDGKLLRGNLLLRAARHDDATAVFEDVTAQFGPVRDELAALIHTHEQPELYFQQLVRENLETFDAEAFLPPAAQRWTRSNGEMTHAMESLADLAKARQLVKETENIVTRLRGALSGGDPVHVFRDMRAERQTSTALHNQLSKTRAELLAVDAKAVANVQNAELASLRAQRRALEERLGGAPTDAEDIHERALRMARAYTSLNKELSRLRVEMLGLDAQITGTSAYMDQTRAQRDASAISAVQAELDAQRAAVASFRGQAAQLAIDIETASLHAGADEDAANQYESLRQQHATLAARERQLLKSLGAPFDARVDAALARIAVAEDQLDARDRAVDAAVAERVREMNVVLDEEGAKLVVYHQRLAELEQDSVETLGGVAYASYAKVHKRFYDLVLRADVGLIDVSWAIREEHRLAAEKLTRERARALKALADEYRDITDTTEGAQ